MFDRATEYPCAVTSSDDQGLEQGIAWSVQRLEPGQSLTLWVPLKRSLANNSRIRRLSESRRVEVITGRGVPYIAGPGPVLMAWPRMDDIGELQRSASRITALCVVVWNEGEIRPWVLASKPELLGDSAAFEEDASRAADGLDPVVLEAMKGLTLTVNHNNTIAAGFEKDQVVGVLLALHDHGYRLDGPTLQGWALAHGWSGGNPQRLADYATKINSGSRPRARRMLRSDYIDRLRARAAGEED